jgi:hypothetical protein
MFRLCKSTSGLSKILTARPITCRFASISPVNLQRITKSSPEVSYQSPKDQDRIIKLGYVSGVTTFVFLLSWAALFGQHMQEDETKQLASQTKRVIIAGGLIGTGIGILLATRATAHRTISNMSLSKDGVITLDTFSFPRKTLSIPLQEASLIKKSKTTWELQFGDKKFSLHPDGLYKPSKDMWEYILRP